MRSFIAVTTRVRAALWWRKSGTRWNGARLRIGCDARPDEDRSAGFIPLHCPMVERARSVCTRFDRSTPKRTEVPRSGRAKLLLSFRVTLRNFTPVFDANTNAKLNLL